MNHNCKISEKSYNDILIKGYVIIDGRLLDLNNIMYTPVQNRIYDPMSIFDGQRAS
jgi:hypothetical protein